MDASDPDPSPSTYKHFSIRPQWRNNRLSFVASIQPANAISSTAAPASTMETTTPLQSPLTQQSRPDYFVPKVVHLYRRLFKDVEDEEKSEGFWRELFLLRPDLPELRQILEEADSEHLLHQQHNTQDIVRHGITYVVEGTAPADENVLETWTVFFAVVLAKRYTNPTSDIIEVLAGIDDFDTVFPELLQALDQAIRDGRTDAVRQKAVRTAIALIAGGYHTALLSYFMSRDFFPSTLKLVQQLGNPLQASEPLLLIGLLADYNKFEVHNQYRTRFADFVNDDAMKMAIDSVSWTCTLLRERYVAIQDDTPANWSISGTLSYVGLGRLTRAKSTDAALTEEQQKELFQEQPGLEASSLLTLYDFTIANKLFCHHFITEPSQSKDQAAAFSNYLSFTSYLYHHAYRTTRSSTYAYLTLVILLVLVEDATNAKLLCETKSTVRLCRQRAPLLPLVKGDRPYALAILDVLTDAMNHNLRKRLDTVLYTKVLTVMSRLLTYLARSRLKLPHHWAEVWRSLLSLLRFLTTYAEDLANLPGIQAVVTHLVDVLSLAMTAGEAFLPDAAAYDDLLYKLVESGEVLTKLRTNYSIAKPDDKAAPINGLIAVSTHYHDEIETHRAKKDVLSAMEVGKIIKQGYETLTFEARADAMELAEKFREAEEKNELKRVTRVVVADAAVLVAK